MRRRPAVPARAGELRLEGVGRRVDLPDGGVLDVLTGVDLVVEPGEHVAVVGRSGSGKSTLLNVLGLLDTPTSGRYLLDGLDAAGLSGRRRARLRGASFGFVFQQFNLLPRRTAVENVAAPLLYARGRAFWGRRRRAEEALARVGLGHRLEAVPESLSGGEQQRVAVARALVRAPRVLLADEPTGALDVETGAAVMDLLEALVTDRGTTLVTITHDLSVAARADRVLRLERGVLTPVPRDEVAGATAVRGSAPDGVARPAAPPGDDGVEADDVDGTGTTARQPVLP
ncbi:ABC transporter ATP-binding protein [Pseudokineococcus lusitanus]|uniref:Putative ABC transport system ATP-binding protein n=1 Tax=Pseudokineococcus lusitanus TaxID=763993 RepID=A0A3N1HQ08_9ACTN|nr:ABC transporter ATP-binding protein [Pseudokineococcus lusitanus]ROP44546.1 putative ABC transport system ATP-binding protein [Pseudokineococcus lusitanus]